MGLRCDLLGKLGMRNVIRAIYLGHLGLSFPAWRDVVAHPCTTHLLVVARSGSGYTSMAVYPFGKERNLVLVFDYHCTGLLS